MIGHTVHTQADELKELVVHISENDQIKEIVKKIVLKQKEDQNYDYISNEQIEIDKIVYGMYGLDEEDIIEVETWYARRYPKLARSTSA